MAESCGWVLVSTKDGKAKDVAKKIKKTYPKQDKNGNTNLWWVVRADVVSGTGTAKGYHVVVSAVLEVSDKNLASVASEITNIEIGPNKDKYVTAAEALTATKHNPQVAKDIVCPPPDDDDSGPERPDNAWG